MRASKSRHGCLQHDKEKICSAPACTDHVYLQRSQIKTSHKSPLIEGVHDAKDIFNFESCTSRMKDANEQAKKVMENQPFHIKNESEILSPIREHSLNGICYICIDFIMT